MQGQAPVAPLRQRQTLDFPYKHSTGETIGRFLAGLKEQKKIWGQRVAGQGVVVPPLGYSEMDGSSGGEWVAVEETGVITAVARVDHPIENLHPFATPFAFVLVQLDGADTALAHVVKDDLDRLRVGSRVQAVWAPDERRIGHIRDIECFRVLEQAPPARPSTRTSKPKARKAPAAAKAPAAVKEKKSAKATKATKPARPTKPTKRKKSTKSAKITQPTKSKRGRTPARAASASGAARRPKTAQRPKSTKRTKTTKGAVKASSRVPTKKTTGGSARKRSTSRGRSTSKKK